ncbi:hypothetical protein MTR_4g101810 [Medicago truncatula]|uniref:Uncharacterized protein n=1 Tax=Medicago truncatula TaxID=3880 RepID=G7JK59_MEDTR|nr:hypothetical protein MTR_4g101810 [Medicago truncatula]
MSSPQQNSVLPSSSSANASHPVTAAPVTKGKFLANSQNAYALFCKYFGQTFNIEEWRLGLCLVKIADS